MHISRTALIAAAMLSVPAGLAFAQVPINTLSGTVIDGTVGDVFGERFILEDETGRVLVETGGPLATGTTIETGDSLVIVGTEGPNGFTATAITREDGTELLVAPATPATPAAAEAPATPRAGAPVPPTADAAPAPQRPAGPQTPVAPGGPAPAAVADLTEAEAVTLLEGMGFTAVRLDEVERRHFEFEARDADNRDIDIELGLDGTLRKFDVDDDARAANADLAALLPAEVQTMITDRGIVDVHEFEIERNGYKVEGYTTEGREIEVQIGFDDRTGLVSVDDGRGPAPVDFDEARIIGSVEAAGYVVGDIERKPRHLEVAATNPEGEAVRLHVDFAGEVYKEQRVR